MATFINLYATSDLVRVPPLMVEQVDLTWPVPKLRNYIVKSYCVHCPPGDLLLFHYIKETRAKGAQLNPEKTLAEEHVVDGGCLFAEPAPAGEQSDSRAAPNSAIAVTYAASRPPTILYRCSCTSFGSCCACW